MVTNIVKEEFKNIELHDRGGLNFMVTRDTQSSRKADFCGHRGVFFLTFGSKDGQCDLIIGSRMHANIAALSMCVPTIALGWSHKYKGIMERLALGKYVCELGTVNLDELLLKVSDAWAKREEIRGLLASKIGEEREAALSSAKLVKELMDFLKMQQSR